MAQRWMYQPGDHIDRYEVVRALGAGSMGMVYAAKDGSRPVAIKVMAQRSEFHLPEQHEEHVRRMEREVSALLPLKHPNIVRVLAFGWTPEELPYYVMEQVDGRSLGTWMRGEPGLGEITRVFRKLAEALGEMHRLGLVHRDLKPNNVLVRNDGEPVLIDFGVVQSETAPTLTRTGVMVGNFLYAAPELAACVLDEGKHGHPLPYTPAYDVHALGLMLYQALSGRYPFDLPEEDLLGLAPLHALRNQTPVPLCEFAPDVPRALGDLVMRMLHKEPARRPKDGAEVARALGALEAPDVAPRLEFPRWARRLAWAALVIGGLVGGALLLSRLRATVSDSNVRAPLRVDAPSAPPQPVRPAEPPALPEKGIPAVPPPPAPSKPAPVLKSSTPKSSASPGAVALCALALSGCVGAELRPDGLPAVCPPPSPTLKPLNIPAGVEFAVTWDEGKDPELFGEGPAAKGFPSNERWPRYKIAIDRPLEMIIWAPRPPWDVQPRFKMALPRARVYGVVRPGKEVNDYIFTRLKLQNGEEHPICAVGYTDATIYQGTRGLPVPPTPPDPPPGYIFIDRGEFTMHVLQPF